MSERITLTDNAQSAIMKLSDGNPRAVTAMMEVLMDNTTDPDAFMGGFGAILSLDSLGIYGTDIYVLFSDICGKKLPKMLAVLRASQLGYLDSNLLKDACSRQDYSGKDMIDVEACYKQVCDRLPNFDKENRTKGETIE